MKLLNRSSLAETIDNVNEAIFYGKKISKSEAKELISWISSRLNTTHSYNKSFGITDKDSRGKVYTFTGERLSSRASMRHIMAEESSRVLLQLSKIAGKKVPALAESNKSLMTGIKRAEAEGKHIGTYCCGPCTVGLWRNMEAGGLGSYSKNLAKGVEVLRSYRDGKGGWGRFPFYYTILALSEMKNPAAKKELNYAMPAIEKKLNGLKESGKFSQRRRDLLLKVLN